ncbi:MAG: hypothetical protein QM756_22480 [Polyangiaceae bacterium]
MLLSNADPMLTGDVDLFARLKGDALHEPHAVLGAHPGRVGNADGAVVRCFHPDAVGCTLVALGETRPMTPLGEGFFACFLPGARLPLDYRLRFHFADGADWERDDPYRFLPTLGELDQHLINEGSHRRLWEVLGARVRVAEGTSGVAFAVWAPSARRVSVVGAFNRWDGRLYPMRALGSSGVWEIFVPGIGAGELYKFEIKTQDGALRIKTDPMAREMELPPATASRVNVTHYSWGDEAWIAARAGRDVRREPVSIYEMHMGSWARVPEDGNRWLTIGSSRRAWWRTCSASASPTWS